MKPLLHLICFLVLPLSPIRLYAQETRAQENNVMRFGLYVVASDLDRSREFYEKLFQKTPYVNNDRLVGFDVAGGLYAVFLEDGGSQKMVRGNNTVPYIRVKEIEKEFERVKDFGARLIDPKIVEEGPVKLFRFADPDGNIIEFFSVVASSPR